MTRLGIISTSVPQTDIDLIDDLDRQLARLREQRDRQCQRIVDRILDGSDVEPGRHTVELCRTGRGSACAFHLVLDGRRIR